MPCIRKYRGKTRVSSSRIDLRKWPYNTSDFDKEPPAFVHSIAENYKSIRYFCHDPRYRNTPPDKVLF